MRRTQDCCLKQQHPSKAGWCRGSSKRHGPNTSTWIHASRWLIGSCLLCFAEHQLCQNLPSHLLSGHPKISRWALIVKAIEEGWGSTGCWTEVLVQKRENKVMATLSVTYSPYHFSNSTLRTKGQIKRQISLINKHCKFPTMQFLTYFTIYSWCLGLQIVSKTTCSCSFCFFFPLQKYIRNYISLLLFLLLFLYAVC